MAEQDGLPMADDDALAHTAATPDTTSTGALRLGWLALGCILVGIGFLGAFVPLLPTTIFLILAAGCFARSSPRLEAWLLNHPHHGPTLRAWREEGAISRRGKQAASAGIALGYVVFLLGARPPLLWVAIVGIAMTGCALWIITRPAPDSKAA